jgi:hypothetical protein
MVGVEHPNKVLIIFCQCAISYVLTIWGAILINSVNCQSARSRLYVTTRAHLTHNDIITWRGPWYASLATEVEQVVVWASW